MMQADLDPYDDEDDDEVCPECGLSCEECECDVDFYDEDGEDD